MDDRQVAREMLKDFYARQGYYNGNITQCPFVIEENVPKYYHECCALIFPGWARKYYKDGDKQECPCAVMSVSYVRRKAREFVKKNK